MQTGQTGRKELTSWKEIADFLNVTLRTAQRYERNFNLPVRRLNGERGKTVTADVDELNAWKLKNVSRRPWESVKPLQISASVLALLVLVLLSYTIVHRFGHSRPGRPVRAYWSSSTLVALDEAGQKVWSKRFPAPSRTDGVPETVFEDLNNDGRVESLVPYVPPSYTAGTGLYCFSGKGEQLWMIEPQRSVSNRKGLTFHPGYLLRNFAVISSPKQDGTKWLALNFVHNTSYPSVAMVVDSKGQVQGEYWHSGHLFSLHATDLENDGRMELLFSGVSNGWSRAEVKVFDAERVGGAEVLPPGHPDQLVGFAPGTEIATIRFGRTSLNRRHNVSNFAHWIGSRDKSDGAYLQVYVSEHLAQSQGYLIYTIGRDLSLLSVTPSVSLESTYLSVANSDPLLKPFGEADLIELRRAYTVERTR